MADAERPDDTEPTGEGDVPAGAAEQPEPEAADAAEAAAEDAAEAPAEDAAEAPATGAPEAASEPQEAAGEPAAREEAAAQPAEPEPEQQPAKREPAKAKGDLPPGAELEPIQIEPERELSAEERARLEAEEEERARREAAQAEDEEPLAARRAAGDLSPETRVQATGKRKTSIARVVVKAGDGDFSINSRSVDEYFPREHHRTVARQALVTSGYEGVVDVAVRVHGGGVSGQAGAVRHGVARALTEIDSELRGELKRRGLLTRDARAKERRKAGLKKARKRPQFSKR